MSVRVLRNTRKNVFKGSRTPGRTRCRRLGRAVGEAGMTTAEYAVGTLAACGFAAVLYKVVTSGAVSSALSGLIERALNAGF